MVTHQLPSTHNSRYTSYNHNHRRRRDAICSTCTYIYVRFFSWRSLSGAWYWSSSSHHHQVADSSTTLELPTEGSAWIGEGPAVQLSHLGGGLQEIVLLPSKEPITYPPTQKAGTFWVHAFPKEIPWTVGYGGTVPCMEGKWDCRWSKSWYQLLVKLKSWSGVSVLWWHERCRSTFPMGGSPAIFRLLMLLFVFLCRITRGLLSIPMPFDYMQNYDQKSKCRDV